MRYLFAIMIVAVLLLTFVGCTERYKVGTCLFVTNRGETTCSKVTSVKELGYSYDEYSCHEHKLLGEHYTLFRYLEDSDNAQRMDCQDWMDGK